MDYEEIFNESYWRALGMGIEGESFADTAYRRFLSHPKVAAKFEGRDPGKPMSMLRISITLASSYYFNRGPDHMLLQFAEQHSRRDLDIDPHLYDYWLDSILAAVKVHDPESNDHVLAAWRQILSPAVEFMRSKYEA